MAKESKDKARIRKTETMRDKAEKAETHKAKPRRLSKTTSAVKKPISKAGEVVTKEYYLITPSETGIRGFLTKRRRFIPKYFRDSFKELKLVTWPNRKETWNLMWAVFIFAIVFGLIITIVDYGLEKLFKGAFL